MTVAEADATRSERWDYLDSCLAKVAEYKPVADHLQGQWASMTQIRSNRAIPNPDTGTATLLYDGFGLTIVGLDSKKLDRLMKQSVAVSEKVSIVRVLLTKTDYKVSQDGLTKTTLDALSKRAVLAARGLFDYAAAEAMAFGSLINEGHFVRVNLDDSRYNPLNRTLRQLDAKSTRLEIASSLGNEFCRLSFEYGYSIENPNNLVIYEASSFDCLSEAQIAVDTYVVSAEGMMPRLTCAFVGR